MSDPLAEAGDDASTPLIPEERDGLIPGYITTRDQLNEVEQLGIAAADQWAFRRRRPVLTEDFLFNLHKRMFGAVWNWAGKPRTTERNIGVPAIQIAVQLRQVLDDVRYWIEHETYPPDEIALRFHARLTWVHPFPNGNGRHARLAADLLVASLGRERFTWGGGSLTAPDELRATYINAVRAADNHALAPLLAFARA